MSALPAMAMACPVCDAHMLHEARLGKTSLLACASCTVTVTHPAERHGDPAALYADEYTLTQTVRASTEQHRYFRYPEYWALLGEIAALQPPPGRWLDIGCDHGFFLDEARRAGFDAVGVELSERASAYARRIGLEVHRSVDEVRGALDVVSMWHTLEHVDGPSGLVEWCARALRPGGLLCIRVPDFDTVWRRIFRQRWIWFQPRVHVTHFNQQALRRLLERHGFEIVFIRRQRPNTRLTASAGRLARRVFTSAMEAPAPSLRDRAARLYQDVTGAELFAVARNRKASRAKLARIGGAMPVVSVIVPTRKRNHLLPRCLQSLYAQTFRDFEVVLVDDNPPESRVANEPALHGLLKDRRLRLVENAIHRNAAAARNCGLQQARGEWITYLDDDDAYRSRKLERQLQRVDEAGVALTCCGLTYHLAGRRRMRNVARTEFSGDELFLEFPAMPAIFHHRAEIRFNEALSAAEDLYFFHELVRRFAMNRVCNIPEPLVDVYLHYGPRVQSDADAVWEGSVAACRDFGSLYSERAAEIFLVRARLVYCKVHGGMYGELVRQAWRLAKLQGSKDARAILGALLFQIPQFRRFLVA